MTGLNNELRENLRRCLKCGLCREVCPVFYAIGEERLTPRGRIAMLQAYSESEDLGKPFLSSLDLCLSCKACTERCPGGVAAELQILAARERGLCSGGMPILKGWAFRATLGHPGLMWTLLRAVRLLELIGAFSRYNPLRFLLPIFGISHNVRIGKLPRYNLDTTWKIPSRKYKGDVLYFAGCTTRFMDPSIGEAVKQLIVATGYRPILPTNIVCCGIPAFVNGDWDIARKLAKSNAEALAGDVPIIVDCGSCGSALKHFYDEVLRIPGSDKLGSRVMDITEFLVSVGYDGLFEEGETVAYHDPCHLARGIGVKTSPRELLECVGGIEELDEIGVCCGGAGTYGVSHPEIYNKIAARKATSLKKAEAKTIATGCPVCVYYLRSNVENNIIDKTVEHTAKILAKRLRGS